MKLNYTFLIVAIVSFGKVTQEQKEEVRKYGLSVYSWDEFLSLVRCSSSLLVSLGCHGFTVF